MKQLVEWVQAFSISWGGPGLFLVAFIDASILSMPQANDVLVVWMTLRHESLMLYYAGMAAAGSVLGSLVIYYIGRKGGEPLLRRRFSGGQVDRTLARFRRWGMATVVVTAILPPPTPFKLFCLTAGAAGMTPLRFSLATGLGRGVRYAGEGLLAVYFGDAAIDYLVTHGHAVAWWLAGLAAACLVLYYWRHQRRRAAV